MNELLSVVVPVYNNEQYIRKCLESILGQTYSNLEVIIVNDGSTDASPKICQEYEQKYPNVRLIHKENAGVSEARRTGIDAAMGSWIAFVDSDDWIEPNMYEQLLGVLEETEAQIAVLAAYTVRPYEGEAVSALSSEEALAYLCEMKFATAMWAGVYPTKLVKQVKSFPDIHFFEDFMFNYMILHKVERVAMCYGKFYHYMDNEESINHQGINEKRMSCLKIIPMIRQGGELYDERLQEKSIFAVAHFLISNIIYLKYHDENSKKYFGRLKEQCRKYRKEIVLAKNVPWSYKGVIWICGSSPLLVSYTLILKKLRR